MTSAGAAPRLSRRWVRLRSGSPSGATRSSTWKIATWSHGTSSFASSREHRPRRVPPAHREGEAAVGRHRRPASLATNVAAVLRDRLGRRRRPEVVIHEPSALLLGVAAELRAHRREDLVGELAVAARLEPLVERAVMTGAGTPLSIAASTVQRPSPESETRPAKSSSCGRAGEGVGGQVDEPRADDRAAPPDLGHLGDVDVVLVGLGVAQRRRLGVDLAGLSCRRRRA